MLLYCRGGDRQVDPWSSLASRSSVIGQLWIPVRDCPQKKKKDSWYMKKEIDGAPLHQDAPTHTQIPNKIE